MAGLDFPTIGAQIAWWENHITKRFLGGWSGSGENGVDIGLPQGTPVYALTGGTIVGHGYYGGGGVVSVEEAPGRVWYYQHLDLNESGIETGRTTQVAAGQIVGWSGGQLSGGNHPSSSQFSDGPHIEVGINAPWGGIWGPTTGKGANIDPWPSIAAIARGAGAATTGEPVEPTGRDVTKPGLDPTRPSPAIHIAFPGGGFDLNWPDWLGGLGDRFRTIFTWLGDPLRILKLIGGGLLLLVATQLTVASFAVPASLAVAGTLTGGRVAGGRSAKARATSVAKTFVKARRRPKPTQTAPKTATESEGEPVYMDGRRVGTSKGGKITMDQGKQAG